MNQQTKFTTIKEIAKGLLTIPEALFVNGEVDKFTDDTVLALNEALYPILCCKHKDRKPEDIKAFEEYGFTIEPEEDDSLGWAIVEVTYPDGRIFRVY